MDVPPRARGAASTSSSRQRGAPGVHPRARGAALEVHAPGVVAVGSSPRAGQPLPAEGTTTRSRTRKAAWRAPEGRYRGLSRIRDKPRKAVGKPIKNRNLGRINEIAIRSAFPGLFAPGATDAHAPVPQRSHRGHESTSTDLSLWMAGHDHGVAPAAGRRGRRRLPAPAAALRAAARPQQIGALKPRIKTPISPTRRKPRNTA